MSTVKTHGGLLSDYLRQCHTGGELMAEYLRRLEAVGIKPYGEGACRDEIVCTPEQAVSTARIFRELCEERGLKIRES